MESIVIAVRVQPGASRTEVMGWRDTVLWLRVQAPALDGRANRAVVDLLAAALGVSRAAVSVQRGLRSRAKAVLVATDDPDAVQERLRGLGPRTPG